MMNHFAGNNRALLSLLFACLCVGSVAAGPGYLPVTGPTPLRLQVALVPAAEVQLPPLRPPITEVAQNQASPTNGLPPAMDPAGAAPDWGPLAPPSSSIGSTPDFLGPPLQPMDSGTPTALPGPLQMPGPAQPPIDPLSLLNSYLAASTNRAGSQIVMPVFIPPPAPAPSAGSHATYESP